MENILKEIIEGVSNTCGDEFFSVITQQLDKVIQSDFTFLARLHPKSQQCEVITLVSHGQLSNNFTYDLRDTPCQEVTDNKICFYPSEITKLFPNDFLLADMNIEGYLGAPLNSSKGEVLGLIVALYESPIQDQELTQTLFQLFSGRIAVELEREDKELELTQLNNSLDHKIKARTAELELTVEQLKQAHEQLVEADKMAVLGDLVAGVAHEVNTPLGVAITAQSHLAEEFEAFNAKLIAEKLSVKDMSQFVSQHQQCLPMMERNLQRSKEIIDNFKRMATEQSDFKQEEISLSEYYQRLIKTLSPLLKRKKAQLSFTGCDNDYLMTYPGCHAQILTNLVNNSVQHGFLAYGENDINVAIQQSPQGFVVDYYDNGVGIAKENEKKIFEPFYTTTRRKGNAGLGLPISFNLVTTMLNGSFEFVPCAQGVHFRYQLPVV